ncbi:MAG: hypothetical protein ACD_39C01830G0001 [uncultured bacterium]|nr:MAG: hypothetical protein ACD_39C01830G0001 [uncultured bacterium]
MEEVTSRVGPRNCHDDMTMVVVSFKDTNAVSNKIV